MSPINHYQMEVVWSIEKHCQSLRRCMYAAKQINNGITATLLQRTAMLPSARCHITLSHVKHPPPAMRSFLKIL